MLFPNVLLFVRYCGRVDTATTTSALGTRRCRDVGFMPGFLAVAVCDGSTAKLFS